MVKQHLTWSNDTPLDQNVLQRKVILLTDIIWLTWL